MQHMNHDITAPGDTEIKHLGPAKITSPLKYGRFVTSENEVLVNITRKNIGCDEDLQAIFFDPAGPREKLYFDPSKTKCAIVTCGGLCPGLNDVIRAIVNTCVHEYHVPTVLGIRYGLSGFIPEYGYDYLELTPDVVNQIHLDGGTILASSRGPQPVDEIVDALERMNISILFMIGGDGTMHAAAKIMEEIENRALRISVVGLPKTIDNDINFISPSFGFDTAVEKATEAIRSAHVEATGAPNGIGLVKLMGRESGFIAAQASIAMQDVNFVLVPEEPFDLEGDNGLLMHLQKRLERKGHAVIVCAEGAGQELLEKSCEKDKSGNVKLGDIAGLLKDSIKRYFGELGVEITLKYIDPSYIIRSVPANANDSIYCSFLGTNAVHAGMAGKTGLVISRWNNRYVHIPMDLVTKRRKHIETNSNYWRAVLESTGQPVTMRNDE